MAIKTKIEWCDSTSNLQAGCDGCELWNPKTGVDACYAGTLTQRWAGRPGWPADCIHTETAFFWKQNGEWAPFDNTRQQLDAAKDKFWLEGPKPELMLKLGKVTAGRLLDGREYSQMPMLPEVAL